MTLEQLIPTLALCQQLKAAGFPQDTALRWSMQHEPHIPDVEPTWIPVAFNELILCAAPTVGELEEWLRQRVGNPLEEITIIISHDGSKEVAYSVGVRSARGKYTIAYGDAEIAAYAALVLEVAG